MDINGKVKKMALPMTAHIEAWDCQSKKPWHFWPWYFPIVNVAKTWSSLVRNRPNSAQSLLILCPNYKGISSGEEMVCQDLNYLSLCVQNHKSLKENR